MTRTEFVYTTYIKTTPEKVWTAITTSEFTRRYWGVEVVSDWKQGSKWESFMNGERQVTVSGEILEAKPPRRLVLTWSKFADADPGHSRVTLEIDAVGDMVRLNVIHDNLKAGSVTAQRISVGWPRVLSSMKSLLETGKLLDTWAGHQSCATTTTKEDAA